MGAQTRPRVEGVNSIFLNQFRASETFDVFLSDDFPPIYFSCCNTFCCEAPEMFVDYDTSPYLPKSKTIVNCSFKATLRDVLIMSKTLLRSSRVVEERRAESIQAAPGSTQVVLSLYKIKLIKKMF